MLEFITPQVWEIALGVCLGILMAGLVIGIIGIVGLVLYMLYILFGAG
jgi:hypothetical protein